MLLGGGIMFHYVLTINSSTRVRLGLFGLITLVLSLAVWAHIKLGDSALHQIVFGTMVVTVGFRTFSLLNRLITDDRLRSKLKELGFAGYRESCRALSRRCTRANNTLPSYSHCGIRFLAGGCFRLPPSQINQGVHWIAAGVVI